MNADHFAEYDACLGVDPPAPPLGPMFEGVSGEEWRPAVGFEGRYEVSSLGNVRSCHGLRTQGKRRLTDVTEQGYVKLSLRLNGKNYRRSVHSLVAAAFIGPRPTGAFIDHLDFNRANNAASNLEYVTPQENTRRAGRAGRIAPRARRCRQCQQPGHNRGTCAQVAS